MKTLLSVLINCVVASFTLWASVPLLSSTFQHYEYIFPFIKGVSFNTAGELGTEYYNIANSLLSGSGFANPFIIPTGPTAWMPPLFSIILAVVLSLMSKELAVLTMVFFQSFCLALSLTFVVRTIYDQLGPTASLISAIFCVSWLWLNFPWLFQSVHDFGLLMLLATSLLFIMKRLTGEIKPRASHWTWWSIVGSVTILASPVLFLAWLTCGFYILCTKLSAKEFIYILVLPFLVGGLWTARNFALFNRLIFIKSNAGFELWLANVQSPTGVYTNVDFAQHPSSIGKAETSRFHDTFGSTEAEIIDSAQRKFDEYLKSNPWDYAKKIVRRAGAATLIYHPFITVLEKSVPIWKYFIYGLPGLSALFLFTRFNRLTEFQRVSLVLYASYLLPFIVVAFYIRYLLPLTPLLMIFPFWAYQQTFKRTN